MHIKNFVPYSDYILEKWTGYKCKQVLKRQFYISLLVFHYNHYEWTRRHDNEVNDQAVDNDDESSLSLDRSFVVRAMENRLTEILLE